MTCDNRDRESLFIDIRDIINVSILQWSAWHGKVFNMHMLVIMMHTVQAGYMIARRFKLPPL